MSCWTWEIFFTLTEAQILIDSMAAGVQHGAAPQRTGLSSPSTGSDQLPAALGRLKMSPALCITTGSNPGGQVMHA